MYNIASRAYPQILFARAALAAAADPPDLAFRSAARRPPPTSLDRISTGPAMCDGPARLVQRESLKWSNMSP